MRVGAEGSGMHPTPTATASRRRHYPGLGSSRASPSSVLLILAAWVSSSYGISVPTGKVGPITPYKPPPPTPHPGPLRDPAPVVEYSPENPEPPPLDPSYVPYSFKTLSALSGNSIFYIPVRIRNIHQDNNANGFSSYYPQSPESNFVTYKGTYNFDQKPVNFNVPIKEVDYAFPKKRRPIVVAPLPQQLPLFTPQQPQQQSQQQPEQQQQNYQQNQQQPSQQYQPRPLFQQSQQEQVQNQQHQESPAVPHQQPKEVPQKPQRAYSSAKVQDFSHYSKSTDYSVQKKRNQPKQEQSYNYETTGKPSNSAYPKKAISEGLPSKYFYYVKHN